MNMDELEHKRWQYAFRMAKICGFFLVIFTIITATCAGVTGACG